MTRETESLITDEMRASIGVEGPPSRHELDKTSVRMFARAVGYTGPVFYDEDYARARGHRSLVAPPAYLGTPLFSPRVADPGPAMTSGSRRLRPLNGGDEYEYTGVEICAGDVLTSVTKTVTIQQRESSLGPMLIVRRESVYTNQNVEVVCRAYSTLLQY